MIIVLWISLLVVSISCLRKFASIKKELYELSHAQNWMYQVDVFIVPHIEEIGRDIENLIDHDGVRYRDSRGIKKYDCWDMGDCGFFYDKRSLGYDRCNSFVMIPSYNKDKEVLMPVRITQMCDRMGNVLSSFDNIEKEFWFNNSSTMCFNYYQFELKNKKNIITSIPLCMFCDDCIKLNLSGACFTKKLFEFPLNLVIYYMIRHNRLECFNRTKNFDHWYSEKECEYTVSGFAEEYLKKECFECKKNDCFNSTFEHKYGAINIVVTPIKIN